jgi:hypothetical protein
MLPEQKFRPRESGFDVQIRRRGKFESLGVSLSKEEAMAFGSQKVLGAAIATYQLKESGRAVKSLGLKFNPNVQALFRKGKGKDQFIQKEKLRILSAGEKREISQVGSATRRGSRIIKPSITTGSIFAMPRGRNANSFGVGKGRKIKFI